jgi:hypothetical protein
MEAAVKFSFIFLLGLATAQGKPVLINKKSFDSLHFLIRDSSPFLINTREIFILQIWIYFAESVEIEEKTYFVWRRDTGVGVCAAPSQEIRGVVPIYDLSENLCFHNNIVQKITNLQVKWKYHLVECAITGPMIGNSVTI